MVPPTTAGKPAPPEGSRTREQCDSPSTSNHTFLGINQGPIFELAVAGPGSNNAVNLLLSATSQESTTYVGNACEQNGHPVFPEHKSTTTAHERESARGEVPHRHPYSGVWLQRRAQAEGGHDYPTSNEPKVVHQRIRRAILLVRLRGVLHSKPFLQRERTQLALMLHPKFPQQLPINDSRRSTLFSRRLLREKRPHLSLHGGMGGHAQAQSKSLPTLHRETRN